MFLKRCSKNKDVGFNVAWVMKSLVIKLFFEVLNWFSLSRGI